MPKIYKELFTDIPESEEFESGEDDEDEEEEEEESEVEVAPVVVKTRKRKIPKLLPPPVIKDPEWVGRLFEEVAYIKKKINSKPKKSKSSPLVTVPPVTPSVPAPVPTPVKPEVPPQATKPKSNIFT